MFQTCLREKKMDIQKKALNDMDLDQKCLGGFKQHEEDICALKDAQILFIFKTFLMKTKFRLA